MAASTLVELQYAPDPHKALLWTSSNLISSFPGGGKGEPDMNYHPDWPKEDLLSLVDTLRHGVPADDVAGFLNRSAFEVRTKARELQLSERDHGRADKVQHASNVMLFPSRRR